MMAKQSKKKSSVAGPKTSHRCDLFCLGPLTFHTQAVGENLRLSHRGRLAERTRDTFGNGLVFSNRPVRVNEKIRLRVVKDLFHWQGALRVGFTNVAPSDRSLPLPPLAIPNLTDRPGHWASPVHESYCEAGSELEFWVSARGSIYVKINNWKIKLLTGVKTSGPLWAMMDIYGQTCSIFLQGSKKKWCFLNRRSCPVPEPLTSPDADNQFGSIPDMEIPADKICVVCMATEASVTLSCGHRCLCETCDSKVFRQFGTCPLCRHKLRSPSVEEWCVSGVVKAPRHHTEKQPTE